MTKNNDERGIGDNSFPIAAEVNKTLGEIFSSLHRISSKFSASAGNTYAFESAGIDPEIRKGTKFERNQLHFEAQQEQEQIIKKVWELKEKIGGANNE